MLDDTVQAERALRPAASKGRAPGFSISEELLSSALCQIVRRNAAGFTPKRRK